MRPSDLAAVVLDVDLGEGPDVLHARLAVYAGRRTLHTATLDDEALCDAYGVLPGTQMGGQLRLPLPATLAAELAGVPGTQRVRFVVSDLPVLESEFEVAPLPGTTTMQLTHARATLQAAPAWIRSLVEAQILHEASYHAAAYALAEAVLRERPEEPHAAALIYATYAGVGVLRSYRAQVLGWEVMQAARERRAARGARCGLEDVVEDRGER